MNDDVSRRGTVLVTVLWLVALLSALAMAAATTFRGFTGIMSVDGQRVQIEGLMTAGLEIAAGMMAALEEEAPLLGLETSVTLASGDVRIRLQDEGGLIDIGKAPVEVIAGLFRAVGIPQADALAQQWVGWRERKIGKESNGAETSPDGSDAKEAVPVPVTHVGQLAELPGMQARWVAAITPLATVFGRATVNPMTAPPAVLAVLPDIDPARLRLFLDLRSRSPAEAARHVSLLDSNQHDLAVQAPIAASVYLQARNVAGLASAARAIITVLSGEGEPYRVLAWYPSPRAFDVARHGP